MRPLLVKRSVTGDVFSTINFCILGQALNARPMNSLNSIFKEFDALIANHFSLGKRNVFFNFLPRTEEFVDYQTRSTKSKLCNPHMNKFR